MQNLRNKLESERVRQKYLFEDRRKKLMADKNKNIIDKTMENLGRSNMVKTLNLSNYEEYEIENSEKVKKVLESDRELLEQLENADKNFNAKILAEENSEIETFESESAKKIEEIELAYGRKRLEISKSNENCDELLATLEAEKAEAVLSARREHLRQRAELEAALKARRRVKLNENTKCNQERLKQRENENRKTLETARKNNRKKQEMSAIKNELGQNEMKDAIKIVKSVLDARHKEELAKLEDR